MVSSSSPHHHLHLHPKHPLPPPPFSPSLGGVLVFFLTPGPAAFSHSTRGANGPLRGPTKLRNTVTNWVRSQRASHPHTPKSDFYQAAAGAMVVVERAWGVVGVEVRGQRREPVMH